MARVLMVEPFYGGSHKQFADGLVAHSGHDIELLTLREGEWRRRMRRGAQELSTAAARLDGDYDVVLATDMLDLCAFLALTRPRFDRTPVLLYFHENQFTYPRLRGTRLNSWFGQINYLSAVAATRVAFNSAFHRDDFLGALRTLSEQPNNWLVPEAIDVIAEKSSELPVGVDLGRLDRHRVAPDPGPPIVLWNHRWEFDKGPDLFVRSLERLADEGLAFRVAVAGERGDNPSPALETIRSTLGERVVHAGYVESGAAYAELLWRSAIVVSTSRQEFFGIATVEAMYCECLPILPRRLNYPALVPGEWAGRCLWDSEDDLMALLRRAICSEPGGLGPIRTAVQQYDWPAVIDVWDRAITEIASLR